MTTLPELTPILTTTEATSTDAGTPAVNPKPKRKSTPRKKKSTPVVEEPKKFDFSQYKGLVVVAVIAAVIGFAKFGLPHWGDNTKPDEPVPAPVEPSENSVKAKKLAIEYFQLLAKDFDDTLDEIKAGKHEDVTSWASTLFNRTTKSKDVFSANLNSMIGPVAGQTEVTPETAKLLEEISTGWKSLK